MDAIAINNNRSNDIISNGTIVSIFYIVFGNIINVADTYQR